MNNILKEFTEVHYDLSKLSRDDLHIKEDSDPNWDWFIHDPLQFRDSKPKETSFHEYFFKPFREHQPHTYEVLKNVHNDFFYAIKKTNLPQIMSDTTAFGIEINELVVYFRYSTSIPYFANENQYNFPDAIINSWFLTTDGWYVAEADGTTFGAFQTSGLPSSNSHPLGSVYTEIEEKNKKAKDLIVFLENKFEQLFLVDYDNINDDIRQTHFRLSSLIDTRHNYQNQTTNFQLFSLVNHQNSKTQDMYVIQDEDIYSIKKLTNPSQAIDKYAAHLLSRQAGHFDFAQYLTDF